MNVQSHEKYRTKTQKNADYGRWAQTALKAWKYSRTVPKSQKLEKRAFSLPYISHNVHYTKL